MASIINRFWSGADFWDKKENQKQRQQFAQQAAQQPQHENPLLHAAGNVVHALAPSTIENRVVQPVVRHVAKPVFNLPQTVTNDVLKPINRDVIQQIPRIPLGGGATLGDFGRELPNATVKVFSPLARSAVGTLQGVSGLYDLATPGTGTSRVSKALNWEAKQLDTQAKQRGINPAYYHIGQGVGDAAQFLIGSGEVKAGIKAASELPKIGRAVRGASNLVNKGTQFGDKIIDATKGGNFGQRVVGRAAGNAIKPGYQSANAAFTALQAGKDASQGKQITPMGVGTNLAIGGLGFPLAGAVGHEVASPAIQKAAQALKAAQLARPSRLSDSEVANIAHMRDISGTGAALGQGDVFNNAYASLHRIGINPNDTNAIDRLLGAHRTHATVVQQRLQALQNAKEKTLQFTQDHPLGMTSGAVDKNGNRLGLDGKPLKVQPSKKVPADPLAALKQEALKYKSADEFVQALQDGKVPIPKGSPEEVAAIQKQLGVDWSKAYDTPTGVYDLQKKMTTDLYNQAHAEAKTPSSAPQSSSRGGVSVVERGDARHQAVEHSPAPAYQASPRVPVRENIPSPAVPSRSALKDTRSPNEYRSQSQPQAPHKQAQNQVSRRKQSQLATNSGKSYPQHTRNRGFSQSVKSSPEVSSEVQKRSGGTYQTRNTQRMVDKAEAHVNKDLPKAVDASLSALDRKKGTLTDQEVTNAITTAKRLDANKNYSQATEIYDKLAEHLKEHGRAIQAASVLNRRTPEGIRHSAFAELKKHGVNVTPEFERAMMKKIDDIKKTTPGSLERDLNIKQLQKLVAKQIPSDLADKVTSTWKAGLLTGIRTQTGNALSNETFSILHNISNLLASPLDKAASLVTKQRSKVLTGRGLVSGTKEGFSQGLKYLKTGIDERSPLENKFSQSSREINFKNKALNTYVNGVFRLMGAADRPHYYRQLRNSLYDLGKTDGLNKGLKGQALRDHVNKFVENPPVEQFQRATHEAEQAVLANDTLLAHAAGKIQKLADEAKSPVGKFFAKVAVHGIAPFTKVPSAFLSRVIDYTPAGFLKEAIVQASKKQFDQRSLVTSIAESTTGTGLVLLGAALAQSGQLSGNYPNDPKEQQRWKAQGIQPNSIKLGNTWVSMNYLGPVGMLFGAGARMNDVKTEKGTLGQQAIAAASGMPKDLTEQSFLQGLNNAVSAINEPDRYASSFAKSQIGSVIPTLANDAATATDSKQRQSDTVPDRIKSRIPGLRETLPVAQDVYGDELKRKTGPISSMVNPFRPSDAITNSVKSEVERLHNADPNNSDLQVTPTPVDRTVSIEGKKVPLTNKQRYDLQKQIGQTTQSLWGQLIKTPEYKSLSDIDKAKALNNLRSDATTLATRTFVVNNNLGVYNKAASSKVAALGDGSANVADYATNANSETNVSNAAYYKTPDAEYKAFLSTYNQNVKAGKYDAAQKITADKKLAKLKVGSVYPKDVRDLYGLSKTDLYNYLTTEEKGVDKAKIAKQLIAYDQALYNAGLEASPKYKNGIAPSKSGRSSSSNAAARAAFHAEMAKFKSPLKIVGALPAPSVASVPKFKTPALRTVYQRKGVNTHPTSSLTKTKR